MTPKATSQPFKQAWPAVLLGGGFLLFFVSGGADWLGWDRLVTHYASIKDFAEANRVVAYALFTGGYAIVVAFSLPVASLLTLAGGAILGWPALVLVVVGATGGASIVFVAARGILAGFLAKRAGPFRDRLQDGFTRYGFAYLLALRLIPVAPFWAVNIIPAFTAIRLRTFIGATAIGIIPGVAVYTGIGRGFDQVLAAGQTPDLAIVTSPHILLPLFGLGLLALLPILYKRGRRQTGEQARDE